MFDTRYISQFTEYFGIWNDQQVPEYVFSLFGYCNGNITCKTTSNYGKKNTGLKLNPNYSYARIYKKGDILHRHKDRFYAKYLQL
jgi:hypothetical protein